MSELKIKLLELLHDDAFLTKDKLAIMLGKEEIEIQIHPKSSSVSLVRA